MIFITQKIDDVAAGDWPGIETEAAKYHRAKIEVTSYSEAAEWSEQQRKWWKGILLPALKKDTGDTIDYWETLLKLTVLPDDFTPITTIINGREYVHVPSVNELSMTKMNLLIERSVAKCHDWGLMWVTLPDKELRKKVK